MSSDPARGSEDVARSARRPVGMRTAGEVAKALELERTVDGARLAQMAESGELKMTARRYNAA